MHGVGRLFSVTWLCVVCWLSLEGMGNFSCWRGWVWATSRWKGFPLKIETVSQECQECSATLAVHRHGSANLLRIFDSDFKRTIVTYFLASCFWTMIGCVTQIFYFSKKNILMRRVNHHVVISIAWSRIGRLLMELATAMMTRTRTMQNAAPATDRLVRVQ